LCRYGAGATDPAVNGVHRLADVARNVAADVHHRIPDAVAQRGVVAGVPVADKPNDTGEQLGSCLAAAEQSHFGAGAQGVSNDGAANERCTAENKNAHRPAPYNGHAR
jgi:hypothetical protein